MISRVTKRRLLFIFLISTILNIFQFATIFRYFHENFKKRSSKIEYHNYTETTLIDVINTIINGSRISTKPINTVQANFSILNSDFCIAESLSMDLLIFIKTLPHNYKRRASIRKIWELQNWRNLRVRKLFIVGRSSQYDNIMREADFYSDIVQYDKLDDIFNTTEKLLNGFQWIVNHCQNTRFVLFQSDEILVSPDSLIALINRYSNQTKEDIFGSLKETNNGDQISWRKVGIYYDMSNDKEVSTLQYFTSCYLCLTTIDMIRKIVLATEFTKFYELEKVFLSIILKKLSVSVVDLTPEVKYSSIDLSVYIDTKENNFLNESGLKLLTSSSSRDPFNYPLNINMSHLVDRYKDGLPVNLPPVNRYFIHHYTAKNGRLCEPFFDKINLLIVVKVRPTEFTLRDAIRQTWGSPTCWDNWNVRRVFSLGQVYNSSINNKVAEEASQFKDIIQQDFVDHYDNNTYKTMMSFSWVSKYCPNAEFIMFVDADFLLNPRNIKQRLINVKKQNWFDPAKFYYGHRYRGAPVRRDRNDKWPVSLKEISWKHYPPYNAGGAFIMTYDTVRDFTYVLPFVRYFRIDDVLLGIISHKLNINPLFAPGFYLLGRVNIDKDKKFLVSHLFDEKRIKQYWMKLGYTLNCDPSPSGIEK